LSDEILSAGFGDLSSVTVERRMEMDSFLAGTICVKCNNGWMSGLEKETGSLLIRLLERDVKPEEMNEEERLKLAKWTIKTAIACNSALSNEPRIEGRFIRQFDCGRSDNLGNCGVFAGKLEIPNKFGYIQTTADNPMILGPEPAELRIAFYIDGLLLLSVVAVSEGLGYTFEVVRGVHEPLWPGRGHEFQDHVNTLCSSGTESDLKLFTDALKVRYRFDLS
jgi:hypothetical protein